MIFVVMGVIGIVIFTPRPFHEIEISSFEHDNRDSLHEQAKNPTRGQYGIQPGVDPFRQFSSYAYRERCRT